MTAQECFQHVRLRMKVGIMFTHGLKKNNRVGIVEKIEYRNGLNPLVTVRLQFPQKTSGNLVISMDCAWLALPPECQLRICYHSWPMPKVSQQRHLPAHLL